MAMAPPLGAQRLRVPATEGAHRHHSANTAPLQLTITKTARDNVCSGLTNLATTANAMRKANVMHPAAKSMQTPKTKYGFISGDY